MERSNRYELSTERISVQLMRLHVAGRVSRKFDNEFVPDHPIPQQFILPADSIHPTGCTWRLYLAAQGRFRAASPNLEIVCATSTSMFHRGLDNQAEASRNSIPCVAFSIISFVPATSRLTPMMVYILWDGWKWTAVLWSERRRSYRHMAVSKFALWSEWLYFPVCSADTVRTVIPTKEFVTCKRNLESFSNRAHD